MTYQKMINAYATLMRMSTTQMPIKAARALYSIRRAIEPTYEFCVEQEQVIVSSHEGKVNNGSITFTDEEKAKSAQQALQDLYSQEAEYDREPVELALDDVAGCKLTMNDLDALEGFVTLT